jgi:hypothetical protein
VPNVARCRYQSERTTCPGTRAGRAAAHAGSVPQRPTVAALDRVDALFVPAGRFGSFLRAHHPRPAHVHYETGAHTARLAWLNGWITGSGRPVHHRGALLVARPLHELALADPDATVRRRYDTQLAPPVVTGCGHWSTRASLLWRGGLADAWEPSDGAGARPPRAHPRMTGRRRCAAGSPV